MERMIDELTERLFLWYILFPCCLALETEGKLPFDTKPPQLKICTATDLKIGPVSPNGKLEMPFASSYPGKNQKVSLELRGTGQHILEKMYKTVVERLITFFLLLARLRSAKL